MVGASWIVLEVGKRGIRTKECVDGEEILAAERRSDALLLEWVREVEGLDPPEEAAEDLLTAVGQVLQHHKDERGVLVIPVRGMETPNGTYAEIVGKHAATGRWIPNLGNEVGVNPERDMREEIGLPEVPRSRKVEIFVMSAARAMRELPIESAPIRAVCMDRISSLSPKEVSAFYLPKLRDEGHTVKRRVWSDGSTEQLVALKAPRRVVVHAETTDDGTYVRVASILER